LGIYFHYKERLPPLSNLKHLAQSLGLSITTVSRALDGYADVAPVTRERVRVAARAINDRPNSAARGLRRRKAETVAVTLPLEPGRFGPPLFLNMLACGQRLAEEGLDLVLLPTTGRGDGMQTYRRLIDGDGEAGFHEAARWRLQQSAPPTALLCATDGMAIDALSALKERGLMAGRDIAVIGHDNLPSAAFTDPPLSTMEIADPDVGRQLAEMLIARLGGRDSRKLQTILPVRQVPRITHEPVN
jgi:DNA-binding LacI/PurR family transcriptional regulator